MKQQQQDCGGHPHQLQQGGHSGIPFSTIAQPAVDDAAVAEGKGPAVYDITRLTNATPQEQKQTLGMWLYTKIEELEPKKAGKITGMLLELENTKIMQFLENQEALVAIVQEAVEVLKDHEQSSKDVPAEQ